MHEVIRIRRPAGCENTAGRVPGRKRISFSTCCDGIGRDRVDLLGIFRGEDLIFHGDTKREKCIFLFGDFRAARRHPKEDGFQQLPRRRVERSPFHLSFRASIFSALPLRHRLCPPFSFFVTRLRCRELFEWAIVSRRSDCSNGTSLLPKKKRERDGRKEGESERAGEREALALSLSLIHPLYLIPSR